MAHEANTFNAERGEQFDDVTDDHSAGVVFDALKSTTGPEPSSITLRVTMLKVTLFGMKACW